MAFCFSGSLLRANFNIVFFLFYIVIVRGKEISSSSTLDSDYIFGPPCIWIRQRRHYKTQVPELYSV